MKRLVAALLLLACSIPAQAADAWRRISLSGNGPTWSDIHCVALGSYIACMNRAATTVTNGLKVINLTTPTSPTVDTYDLPSPSTATFGRARGLGGSGSTPLLVIGGGGINSTGRWIATSGSLSSVSFTLQEDSTNIDDLSWAATITPFGTGTNYFMALPIPAVASANDRLLAVQITLPTYGVTGSQSYTYSGKTAILGDEAQGGVVSSTFAIACVLQPGDTNSTGMGCEGINNSAAALFNPGAVSCSATGTTATLMRPMATYSTTSGVFFAYDATATKTLVCGWNSAGSQTFPTQTLSTDVRPGAYWDPTGSLAGLWAWGTTGGAYRAGSSGLLSPAFTYSIPSSAFSGGVTLSQAVLGIDVDGDSSTSDNPIAVLSDGSIAYWGELISGATTITPDTTTGRVGRSSTGTGPFR